MVETEDGPVDDRTAETEVNFRLPGAGTQPVTDRFAYELSTPTYPASRTKMFVPPADNYGRGGSY